VHYAFNTRLDTPFWQACRNETDLAGAAPVVEWFRENGPSVLAKGILIPEANSFGFEGYLAMLVGQKLAHVRTKAVPMAELQAWRNRRDSYAVAAQKGMTVKECLAALRKAGWMKRT
jgi:tryptophan halogenase